VRHANAKSLDATIAQRIRELREARRIRQDDLATAARSWGLPWTRATIASIETGKRKLSVAEFIALPSMLTYAGIRGPMGKYVELADLLPEEGWIGLAAKVSIHAKALQHTLRGRAGHSWSEGSFSRNPVFAARDKSDAAKALRRVAARIWPQASERAVAAAEAEAAGDAEQKAALRLGRSPFEIAVGARMLWGQSLTKERDEQVSRLVTNGPDPRRVQALRGHVTRKLLSQLKPFVR
jgi:transcriptional regulator with XRE-family HTH domain